MEAKKLVDLRKQAEKAVAEMPDGELKVKAFEVILAHLLAASEVAPVRPALGQMPSRPPRAGKEEQTSLRSLTGRLLVLKDEGFFKNQRAISEVKEELSAHGWHYP